MIRQWNEFMRRPEVQGRAAFLSDYDMRLTQALVEGVDVWLNTPRRPWEASGTSGMKVLANGGLNLSELDGWWAEAYAPDVGWAIGDGKDRGEDPAWDAAEATALYELLEREVIPSFYDRNQEGIPQSWVARMRASMARLTALFSSNRSVRQYTEEFYLPLASAYTRRAADGGKTGAQFVEWKRWINARWHDVRFENVAVDRRHGAYAYEVVVHLGSIVPGDVLVELYADPRGSEPLFRSAMTVDDGRASSPGVYRYRGVAPDGRPVDDYTPRVVPYFSDALVPLELPLIAWQK
jgi:starch phosphorylase